MDKRHKQYLQALQSPPQLAYLVVTLRVSYLQVRGTIQNQEKKTTCSSFSYRSQLDTELRTEQELVLRYKETEETHRLDRLISVSQYRPIENNSQPHSYKGKLTTIAFEQGQSIDGQSINICQRIPSINLSHYILCF